MISGTIMTIAKDRVKPSPHPDSWKLNEIFATGVVYGAYMAVMTVVFFWAMRSTDFFSVSIFSSYILHDQLIQIKQMKDSTIIHCQIIMFLLWQCRIPST